MKNITFFKHSRPPSDVMEAEVDLDIRPFMNVLLILIPFLASVAVYTRISTLEMRLPPNVSTALAAAQSEKPKLKITVVLRSDIIGITYGDAWLDSIPRAGNEYNYAKLRTALEQRRNTIETKNEILVAVKDDIRFQFVVRVMDACREAGFADIGLAGATENPMAAR